MKKTLYWILLFCGINLSLSIAHAQTTIKILDEVLFYDGYRTLEQLADEMVEVPDGVVRLNTTLYSTKLTEDQLSQIGEELVMNITVKAACDNYDRLGHASIALVPKGMDTYVPEEVQHIEIGRFITPFMDKNKLPDTVPYTFHVDYLKYIFRDKALSEKYDFWAELSIFGVPYAANEEIAGCEGRSDVFYGSLEFETTTPPVNIMEGNVLLPLFFQTEFNNYAGTDEEGKTIRNIKFSTNKDLQDAQLVLITSNHGAGNNGEEYTRRKHYVYFDSENVLTYTPGRTTCEPFRKYNTQANWIYGYSPKPSYEWQFFSNWCPGDIIDNRIISLNALSAGTHTFSIEVPDAKFLGDDGPDGNFPLSLYLIGRENGYLGIEDEKNIETDFISIVSGDVINTFTIYSPIPIKDVQLYNLAGAYLYNGTTNFIDLNNYSSGVYIVKVTLTNGNSYTEKIVKNKGS